MLEHIAMISQKNYRHPSTGGFGYKSEWLGGGWRPAASDLGDRQFPFV